MSIESRIDPFSIACAPRNSFFVQPDGLPYYGQRTRPTIYALRYTIYELRNTIYESIADERSRTSTGVSPQAPEACASASSATSATLILSAIASVWSRTLAWVTKAQRLLSSLCPCPSVSWCLCACVPLCLSAFVSERLFCLQSRSEHIYCAFLWSIVVGSYPLTTIPYRLSLRVQL